MYATFSTPKPPKAIILLAVFQLACRY